MKLIEIGLQNLNSFKKFFTPDAAEVMLRSFRPVDGEYVKAFGIGLVVDYEPAGAIVCALDDEEGVADIVSIFVRKKCRRMGYGTELVLSAAAFIDQLDLMYQLRVDITEYYPIRDEEIPENSLGPFFSYLEFKKMECEEVGAFACTLSDAEVLNRSVVKNTPYTCKLSECSGAKISSVVNFVPGGMEPYLLGKLLDLDVSVVNIENNACDCCVLIQKTEEGLIVKWVQATGGKELLMIELLSRAFLEAKKKYPADTKVIIPYIHAKSKLLIQKLLGNQVCLIEENGTYAL